MTEPAHPPARRAKANPEGERPGHEYDPLTGKFLDGPHPEDPDNNEGAPKTPLAENGGQK